MDQPTLLRRFRISLAIFIAGLMLSGITAFPLESELTAVVSSLPRDHSSMALWLTTVQAALKDTNHNYPFLAYGTDWLAFAHLVIAGAYIGPWLEPVRNKWLVTFGLFACAAVIPLAWIAGECRGIPILWRLVDSSFGAFGAIPLIVCRHYLRLLERFPNQAVGSLAPGRKQLGIRRGIYRA